MEAEKKIGTVFLMGDGWYVMGAKDANWSLPWGRHDSPTREQITAEAMATCRNYGSPVDEIVIETPEPGEDDALAPDADVTP